MIDDDLDQKNRKESIQHYARKKRENGSLAGVILTLILLIAVVVAVIFVFIK
ncbi:MAG TPA: hypothetical protein VK444_06470 [Methanobacteriaceae archaeon]|nr:hypothetical protein [Methanobacteriaceae archaeon]